MFLIWQVLEAQFRRQFSCPPSSPTRQQSVPSTTETAEGDVAAYVLQPDGTMAAVR